MVTRTHILSENSEMNEPSFIKLNFCLIHSLLYNNRLISGNLDGMAIYNYAAVIKKNGKTEAAPTGIGLSPQTALRCP